MADKNTGGNRFVMGKVVNRKDDPTQTGRCRVRWNIGAASQSELGDDDLPWSTSLQSSGSNPSKKGMGGPHTGYQEESSVYGFSIGDGQDFIILGSVPSAGNSDPSGSGQQRFDSEIPAAAKSETNGASGGGGESQPNFGDKNNVVTNNSIWQFGQDEGGHAKKPSKYPELDDPIGTDGEDGDGGKDLSYESTPTS